MAIKKVVQLDIKTTGTQNLNKNLKGIKKDLKDIGDQADKAFAEEDLQAFNAELGKTGEAVKSVKTRLRELEDEMADIGDVSSPQFQKLAKEAGKLKDQVNNAKAATKAMSDDFPKLKLGMEAFNSMGGAAQAATGAVQLFGSENEALTKGIQKMMAIQSILNGVNLVAKSLSDETALGLKIRTVLTRIQNKEQEKNTAAIVKNNIATKVAAFSQGVWTAVVGTTTGAMKLLRIAMIATGIGALVVGVVALIMNFEKVSKWVTTLYEKMGTFGKVIKNVLVVALFPFIAGVKAVMWALEALGVIEDDEARATRKRHQARMKQVNEELAKRKEAREALKKAYNEEQNNLDKLIALASAQGKSTAELSKQKIEGSIEFQKNQVKEIENSIIALEIQRDAMGEATKRSELGKLFNEQITKQREALEEAKDAIVSFETEIVAIETTARNTANANYKQSLSDRLTEKRKIEDLANELEKDAETQKLERLRLDHERELEDLTGNEQEKADKKLLIDEKYQRDARDIKLSFIEPQIELNEIEIGLNKDKNQKIIESDRRTSEEKKAIAREETKAKAREAGSQFTSAANGLQMIADFALVIAGKNEKARKVAFNIQKASSIAQATIDTYKNATAAYGSFASIPVVGVPLGIAAATAAVAAGFANIKGIASTQFEGGGGGTPSTPSAPNIGGGSNVANFNVVGESGINQLADSLGNNQDKPVQAYVVSGDVTTAQGLDRNKIETATL
jgi:hypothetical protein